MTVATEAETKLSDYTLKAVKQFTGREGPGFNANLYRGNKKVAFVYDDASGGPYGFDWVDYAEARVAVQNTNSAGEPFTVRMTPEEARFNALTVGKTMEAWGTTLTYDMDLLVSDLLDAYELKKACRTKTLFRTKDNGDDEHMLAKVKYSPAVKQRLEREYGDNLVEIINERFM
jgi:hypothetical protein